VRDGSATTWSRRHEVLRRMDGEWEALQHDPAALGACRRWSDGSEVLRGCGTPAEVLARVPDAPDAVLLLLLREAVTGDGVAARVVLQALLPKAVLMSATDPVAGVDDYLAALWCAVATYPVRRRPTSVAANLALDTLKAVRREVGPRPDLSMPPQLVLQVAERRPSSVVGTAPSTRGPYVEEVLARAYEHGLVDPPTRAVLRSVYAEGLPGALAARRHGLTPVALRSRCSRALRVLADHRELLGALS
jgi:DNA-directed RNA polymerase specialized sigma24 family protein